MKQADENPLKVENSLDVLLLLLYAPGKTGKVAEPIEGMTRLQKLAFLLQKDLGPKKIAKTAKKEFKFEAYKMGPFSQSVRDDINELISAGLVRTERLRYLMTDDGDSGENYYDAEEVGSKGKVVESLKYWLTPNGMDAGGQLWTSINEREREEFEKFKVFYGGLTLRQLLIFVYERYPEMTGKSEITDQLDL